MVTRLVVISFCRVYEYRITQHTSNYVMLMSVHLNENKKTHTTLLAYCFGGQTLKTSLTGTKIKVSAVLCPFGTSRGQSMCDFEWPSASPDTRPLPS